MCVEQYERQKRARDPDMLAALVAEVVPEFSCLVFCATKRSCESTAQLLCQLDR